MENSFVKIIETFNIKGRRIVSELQHQLDGLPPETILQDTKSEYFWVVKKRILSGILIINNSETYFDCETELDHLSMRFETETKRKEAIEKETQKRKDGIYWYLLKPHHKNQNEKPTSGSILEIKL